MRTQQLQDDEFFVKLRLYQTYFKYKTKIILRAKYLFHKNFANILIVSTNRFKLTQKSDFITKPE